MASTDNPYGFNKPPLPGSVISSRTIDALERAHSLDDGHIRAGLNSSAKEVAAFKLGKVFEKALPGGEASAAYLTAMRQHCRRDGKRVHPYGWAAFVFIDNEYKNRMPW